MGERYVLGKIIREWLTEQGLHVYMVNGISFTVDIIVLAIAVVVTDFLTRKILVSTIHRIVSKTKNHWDDYFYEQKVFTNAAHIVPALIVKGMLPYVFSDIGAGLSRFIATVISIYMVVLVTVIISKSLKALENISEDDNSKLQSQQIRSISQVFRILAAFIGLLVIVSIVFKIKLGGLLGGMAGATAILILIFQDTINGVLANFQINMYDLINKGDWITFEKFGVDGDVVSIDLTTVKVRNWDKTISSIPSVAFVSDSFVNWRGMQETNARRIKRNILIDIRSIDFASTEMLNRYKKVDLVKDYIDIKQDEIIEYNQKNKVSSEFPVNGRRQTNVGIYRAYVQAYLKNHPKIDTSLSLMVRQLQPNDKGLPIEVYCFSNDIVWANYEDIQADIFDHLFAATKFFGLRLYQSPGGYDLEDIKLIN